MFLQAIIGMSATNSGETLIPLMLGVMVASIISGFMLKRTGYKVWLILGPPLAAGGLCMLPTLSYGRPVFEVLVYLVVVGAGLWCVMYNYLVATQNVVCKKEMGLVSSSMTLFRSIGGSIGVSVLGAVLNSPMIAQLTKNLPAGAMASMLTADVNSIGTLSLSPLASSIPASILDAIRLSYGNSLTYTFLIGSGIVIVARILLADKERASEERTGVP
jgi:fucose permease